MNAQNAFTLNRRELIRGGGALVIGFGFWSATRAQNRTPAAGPPDPEQIDCWIAIHADNTATVYIGFAELGQGCSTALLQVVAEELDLGIDRIDSVGLDTHITPNQGGTYSSSAMRRGGPQVQRAAAEARQALLTLAAERLSVPAGSLRVENGVVSSSGNDGARTTYGELIGDRRFDLPMTGTATLKDPDSYRVVARPLPRKDIPLKAKGTYRYMQHQRLPGMLHGRIVRPRGQGAYRDGVRVLSINENSIANIPARILRKDNFVAVVAEREWDAVRAAAALEVRWQQPESLPGTEQLFAHMEAGGV
jgi:CO/xanthine dehydrogenase Mo-binding subunit